jgi:hypothetical protein
MPSVQLDTNGPDWPLGFIQVVTPRTPVNIMSLIDAYLIAQGTGTNNPSSGATREYSYRCNQIIFQGYKPKAGGGTQINSGNVYIVRAPTPGNPGSAADTGCITYTLTPGSIWTLAVPPSSMNSIDPYRYLLDADNAGDGAFPTLIIGG